MQCDKIENIIIYPPSLPMFFSAERIDLSMRALFCGIGTETLLERPSRNGASFSKELLQKRLYKRNQVLNANSPFVITDEILEHHYHAFQEP